MQMTLEIMLILAAATGLFVGLLLLLIFFFRWQKKTQQTQLLLVSAEEKQAYLTQRVQEQENLLLEQQTSLEQFRASDTHLREELSRARSAMESDRQAAQEKEALLEQARETLTDAFKALSADALKANNQQFIDLAQTTLGRFQEKAQNDLHQRQQVIDNLVKPVHESLNKMDDNIHQLEKAREGAYQGLSQKLIDLSAAQAQLHSETENLVKALRAPTVRGRWGEIQLRRVVELAGMVNYCDFFEQKTVQNEGGTFRPDMLIKLPNGKQIVVDSKAPLMGYLEALEASTEAERVRSLQQHARQIRTHLQQLSTKNYWSQFQNTPEFVVLFLPGETFFSAALEQDPSLIEVGVQQNVILATPTTLIGLLKSVAYGWRQEVLAENSQQICQLGQELYDRIAVLTRHFAEVKKGLERAVASYNKTAGAMESRVLVSARKFKDLGTDNSKEIDRIEPIETLTRAIDVPETRSHHTKETTNKGDTVPPCESDGTPPT